MNSLIGISCNFIIDRGANRLITFILTEFVYEVH